jgi:hypothetical protein
VVVMRRVSAGCLVAVFALATTGPTHAALPGSPAAVATTLPPEFTGTLTVTFDVTALESNSDLTPGHYDQSHLTGTLTLSPKVGATSQPFDNYLFAATTSLTATSTVTRYAPDGPCQNHTFNYAPVASDYPDYPAYFSLQTPEKALVTGHPWGLYLGNVVGAQTNGCPGQDGNWPIENFQQYVAGFLSDLTLPNADTSGGRTHLTGTRTVDLSYPAVVESNSLACAADGVYYDSCFTSWTVAVAYDLQRISASRPASQYPTLKLTNNARDDDVVLVRTDTAVKNTRVVIYLIVPGRPTLKSMGPNPLLTNAKGVVRLVLNDRKKSKKRWFLAYVDGTAHVLPGMTITKSIK